MCRTIVGVSANLCPVDPEGKNLHSSVSSQFADGIRQAGGLPMVIPMGDPSLVKDYVETIDKLILSSPVWFLCQSAAGKSVIYPLSGPD